MFEKFFKMLKGYETYWMMTDFVVCVDDPEDVKTVLKSKFALEKGMIYSKFFIHGLLVERRENYRSHRKLINHLFTTSALRKYIPTLNSNMNKILQIYQFNGKTINIGNLVSEYVCRNVLETILSGISGDVVTKEQIVEIQHRVERYL